MLQSEMRFRKYLLIHVGRTADKPSKSKAEPNTITSFQHGWDYFKSEWQLFNLFRLIYFNLHQNKNKNPLHFSEVILSRK